jgi:hypothetical protein
MTSYANLSGHSGVVAYEIRDEGIVIQFRKGGKYLYNYDIPGRPEVDEMKHLAVTGRGLATYINKNVGKRFAKKLS